MTAKSPIHIVALCGSLRPTSYTRMAAAVALAGAAELGATTHLIDLREYDLIFCDGKHPHEEYPADVRRLREDLRAAQGIILATPEYHGSYSGVLKNALDLTGFDEFGGKMVGLIGVSGGRMGGINALNELRNVGRSLHAWVVPEQTSIPEARLAFAANGDITDEKLAQRLKNVGQQVARFSFLHSSEDALEFMYSWEKALANPGG